MILLDTNICKAIIREDRRVASQLLQKAAHIYLPFVVSAELYFGLEKLERAGADVRALRDKIENLHARIQGVVHSDQAVVGEYGRLRGQLEAAGTPIGANDLWIAAVALAESATLVTANTREFARVPDLRLENWLQ